MRRLDRYIASELLGPVSLGFLVYTFILLLRFLFQSAEMIIRRGVPGNVVGRLLLTTLPNIVVLTIPMALLFGILTAVGRLAADSELTAMRSSGVSLMTLYRPILMVSTLLTLLNTALMVYALPWGNSSLQRLRLEILSQSVSQQVEPRVFWEEWDDKVVYISEISPDDNRWKGVLLAQSFPTPETQVTVAEWGEVRVDEAGERVVLDLTDAYTHEVDLNNPDRYRVHHYDRLELVLEDRFTSSRRAEIMAAKGVRELSLLELRQRVADPDASAEAHNLARVEIHKKFAIPAACLVFGLVGLPLGFNNRRGGKASGFALSILVILVYYVLFNNGERAARFGKVDPWLAMWLPNLLLTAVGLFLLTRKNRDKSLLLSRVDRWVREDLWGRLLQLSHWRQTQIERRRELIERRRSGHRGGRPALKLRIQRPRLFFPNLLDRYVLRLFGSVLVLVLASGVSLYIIADLSQKTDDIFKNHIPWETTFRFYRYLSLQITYELAPILVLITTLIAFSLLTRSNEVTASKALGISLYRLSVPAVVAAALVAAGCAYLQSEVLPATNQEAQRLEDRILGRETVRTYRRADRQWLLGQGRYVYNYLHYDPKTQSLQRLQVFEFDDNFKLVRRLAAEQARWEEGLDGGKGTWIFENGWARSFDGTRTGDYRRFEGPVRVDYPETPDYFNSEIRPPELMRYQELRHYINELKASGQRALELEVQLYNKIAFPATSLVMALVGLPFAFRLGRQGALYGIGVSIFLGMIFFATLAVFGSLGEAGLLPPAVAVWSPSAVFATLAVYLFLGIRT